MIERQEARRDAAGVLVLEDGSVFPGVRFGAAAGRVAGEPPCAGWVADGRSLLPDAVGEVVFNTGMTGYQEVLTDPSYAGQIVVMTFPLVGNYGTAADEAESRRPWVAGFVVHEPCAAPSHWGNRQGLPAYMAEGGVPGMAGVDTRALTRHLRRHGTVRGCMWSGEAAAAALADPEAAARVAQAWHPAGLVERVTTERPYVFAPGEPRVVLIDYGAKANIARTLAALGAGVTVAPAGAAAAEILALRPDGVLLSNGPGDPRDVRGATDVIRDLLREELPIFGICLGHQLLGLALGGRTEKMLFGHRGVNHPVMDLRTGRGAITTQNHGYALLPASLDPHIVEITHRNLNDGTVEGLRHRHLPAFSVQYHPEAAPGPCDSRDLFTEFLDLCRARARCGERSPAPADTAPAARGARAAAVSRR